MLWTGQRREALVFLGEAFGIRGLGHRLGNGIHFTLPQRYKGASALGYPPRPSGHRFASAVYLIKNGDYINQLGHHNNVSTTSPEQQFYGFTQLLSLDDLGHRQTGVPPPSASLRINTTYLPRKSKTTADASNFPVRRTAAAEDRLTDLTYISSSFLHSRLARPDGSSSNAVASCTFYSTFI